MRTLKITISYRGTKYHGFQRQPNALTIQEVLEKAISQILNTSTTVHGCSRTDTGVHANRFVLHIQTERTIPVLNFIRAVNGALPMDISILNCEEVSDDFHARFSAKGKEYVYKIHCSESKNPFLTDLALHYRRPVHLERMQAAANLLVGVHDFKSFCASGSKVENTIREIRSFQLKKEGDLLECYVRGTGFLYNMVRICIGTLLHVNEGYMEPEDITRILDSCNRLSAGPTAPAHGLYLNQVFYDEDAFDHQ